MAVVISNGRGRPHFVAEIDSSRDLALAFYDDFLNACRTFCYRDVMALSRKLDISPRTVYAWKYGEQYPRMATMLTVLTWVAQGKPMKLEQPGIETFSML